MTIALRANKVVQISELRRNPLQFDLSYRVLIRSIELKAAANELERQEKERKALMARGAGKKD